MMVSYNKNGQMNASLRDVMFEQLEKLHCSVQGFHYLKALTNDGTCCKPFEERIAPVLLRFFEVFDVKNENSFEIKVIAYATTFIENYAASIDKEDFRKMVAFFCRRCIKGIRCSVRPCLAVLNTCASECVLRSDVLVMLVTTLSHLSLQKVYFQGTWDIFALLFQNNYGCDTVRILRKLMTAELPSQILTELPQDTLVSISRGAVFSVAMAFWGPERFDMQLPISFFMSSLIKAIYLHYDVCKEVIHLVHILVMKHASSIDPLSWQVIYKVLAVAFSVEDVDCDRGIRNVIHDILTTILDLRGTTKFTGPTDLFVELAQKMACVTPAPMRKASAHMEVVFPTKAEGLENNHAMEH